jgi:transposase
MDYGAIDLHTQHSQIQIVDAQGVVQLATRIVTTPEALRHVFGPRARLRVLLETGTESDWVATTLETLGHEVVIADPNFAPMYGDRQRRVKTDRRDVAALAEANRRGWFRAVHRVSAAQRQMRQQLLVRTALIRMRTQAINVLRTIVRSTGARVPTGAAESVTVRVRALALPAELRALVAPLVQMLDALAPRIAATTRALEAAAAADPIVRRLMTAPGVGPITAWHYRATIDRIERFADARAVTAYLGVVPRERSSGERRQRAGITKAGPPDTRAMLVQAAWVIWRTRPGRPGAALAVWAHALAARRGKKVAAVAVARRLARILFAMWRDGRDFVEPIRAQRHVA